MRFSDAQSEPLGGASQQVEVLQWASCIDDTGELGQSVGCTLALIQHAHSRRPGMRQWVFKSGITSVLWRTTGADDVIHFALISILPADFA